MPKDEMKRFEKFSNSRPVPYVGSSGDVGFMSAKKLAKKSRKKVAQKKAPGK